MPVQSVELLLDPRTDERVRGQWTALADAGLPALNPASTPHVTLGAAHEIWPRIDRLIGRIPFAPLHLRIGALAVFTRARTETAVLVRLITPSVQLLDLHQAVTDTLASAEKVASHTKPGEWTPHITLARRFPLNRIDEAVHALHGAPELAATATAIRRWDGVNRKSWLVAGTLDESDPY